MDGFKEGYSFYADSVGPAAAAQMGSLWVEQLSDLIGQLETDLLSFSDSGKTIDFLSGDLAEYWYADTFNIDAFLQGSSDVAEVPRSTGFATPDVRLRSGGEFQVKQYADGARSAKAQAASFLEASKKPETARAASQAIADGANLHDPIYEGMKRVIPEGQTGDAVDSLSRKIAKEAQNRPEQVRRLEDTLGDLTETVSNEEGVSSKPLHRETSKELAREVKQGKLDLKSKGISPDQLVKLEHVAKSSLKTGMSAAAIAMAVKAAPVIASAVKEAALEGGVDIEQLIDGSIETAQAGTGAFLAGTITAALTEAAGSGLLGEALQDVSPGAIAMAAVLAMESLKEGFRLAKGEIGGAQFAEAIFQKTYYALIALGGGTLGQSMLPIPVLGYLLGSLAGSLVAGITYEIGSTIFVGLCAEKGLTFFGLVKQDYTLPPHVLEEIGIEVFEYEAFSCDRPALEMFEPQAPCLASCPLERFEVDFPRRGLIAFNRIGYV